MTKILFIGDIVGRPGRRAVKAFTQNMIEEEGIHLVIANGENAAGGFGLSNEVSQELLSAGVDVITLGNHTWDNKEIFSVLDREPRVIRPANYPDGTQGVGYYLATATNGNLVGVINVLGQVFLDALNCPFRCCDEYVEYLSKKTKIIVVDIHAEATSEKMALGWYLDGRVSAVIGTHTHIATADERILPGGTGYITDAGMTGPLNSVLGIDPKLIIHKFLTKRPVRFEVASGPTEMNGVIIEVDDSGLTENIRRIKRSIE